MELKILILILRTSIQSIYENLLLKLGMTHSSRTKKKAVVSLSYAD